MQDVRHKKMRWNTSLLLLAMCACGCTSQQRAEQQCADRFLQLLVECKAEASAYVSTHPIPETVPANRADSLSLRARLVQQTHEMGCIYGKYSALLQAEHPQESLTEPYELMITFFNAHSNALVGRAREMGVRHPAEADKVYFTNMAIAAQSSADMASWLAPHSPDISKKWESISQMIKADMKEAVPNKALDGTSQ